MTHSDPDTEEDDFDDPLSMAKLYKPYNIKDTSTITKNTNLPLPVLLNQTRQRHTSDTQFGPLSLQPELEFKSVSTTDLQSLRQNSSPTTRVAQRQYNTIGRAQPHRLHQQSQPQTIGRAQSHTIGRAQSLSIPRTGQGVVAPDYHVSPMTSCTSSTISLEQQHTPTRLTIERRPGRVDWPSPRAILAQENALIVKGLREREDVGDGLHQIVTEVLAPRERWACDGCDGVNTFNFKHCVHCADPAPSFWRCRVCGKHNYTQEPDGSGVADCRWCLHDKEVGFAVSVQPVTAGYSWLQPIRASGCCRSLSQHFLHLFLWLIMSSSSLCDCRMWRHKFGIGKCLLFFVNV